MERRRRREPAADDHPPAVAGPAVAGRAEDQVALAAQFQGLAVDVEGELVGVLAVDLAGVVERVGFEVAAGHGAVDLLAGRAPVLEEGRGVVGSYFGWSYISRRQPAATAGATPGRRRGGEAPARSVVGRESFPVGIAPFRQNGTSEMVLRLQAFQEPRSSRRGRTWGRRPGRTGRTVLRRVGELGDVEQRVVQPGQAVEEQHPEDRRRRGEQDRQLERDRDERRPARSSGLPATLSL